MLENTPSLCSALRDRIVHYKTDHPNLSSQQIAKRFNMSSSSLNRIENQDIINPTIDQVLKVLRGTGATGDMRKYLDERYPQIAEMYREVYSQTASREFIDVNIEEYFTNPTTFLIMIMSHSDRGVSRDEIISFLGQKGESTLNSLIKESVLKEHNGQFEGCKTVKRLSTPSLAKLISLSAENCFDHDTFGITPKYIAFRATSVNKHKALPVISKIMAEAYNSIDQILNNEEYDGDDYVFMGMITDSLLSSTKELLQ